MTSRKSINHPQLIRICKIHKRILSGCYPNSNELARELEASVITISRDIEFMRDSMLAPIAYDAVKRGYYYSENFDMPNYSLSDKEATILTSAKILLSHFIGTPFYEEARNIINVLSSTVIKSCPADYIDRIALPSRPVVKYEQEIWDTIWNAVKQNRILEFDYSGLWRTDYSHRIVRPYQLLMDHGLFLFGYCEAAGGERLFSIARIENLVVTEKTFELPENYSYEDRLGGGKFGPFFTKEHKSYKIAFYEEARPLVRETIFADDQKVYEDEARNCTIVTFSACQDYKIHEWVLSFGSNAKPLEPREFVEGWKNDIDSLLCRSTQKF